MWTDVFKKKMDEPISIGCVTDRGNVREINEDSVWFAKKGTEALCMVADGVGGCHGGEIASATAAKIVELYWKKSQAANGLKRIFDEANVAIRAQAGGVKSKSGTTLSVLYCLDNVFWVAHAGDTRIYRLTRKPVAKITLLTQDDSWVAEKLREGVITADEAIDHPKRHTLTNCLGGFRQCKVFETSGRITKNDMFLLCSDGLYNYMDEQELKNVLNKCVDTQKTADSLLELALTRGGKDNISVIVVKFC